MAAGVKRARKKIIRQKKSYKALFRRKKSIFTKLTGKTWSKYSVQYHTLYKLPSISLITSRKSSQCEEENSTELKPTSASYPAASSSSPLLTHHKSSAHIPPLHTLHDSRSQSPHLYNPSLRPSHLHNPPSHSVSTHPNRSKTFRQKNTTRLGNKQMAHANSRKSHYQDNGVLPLYNNVHLGMTKEPSAVVKAETVAELYVLCVPLHKLNQPVQFSVCVVGVLFFYLLYGYTQEWIFSVEGFKPFGWYLTMVQFVFYSLFGFAERKLRNEGRRKIPLRTYVLLAFLTVSTMGLSNTSLGYLNYPTQIIFKSCKLIPVMIGGMLIQGKKYSVVDGVALVCMSIGLILFTLADSTVQPEFNQTGVLLISLALCADAVIGNVQEKALKQYSASNLEMVLFSYFIGFWYLFALVTISGTLFSAFSFCMEHPKMYFMAFIFSLTGYLGINFVLVLVRSFGALVAVTVTTFRKAITMVLSFLLFTKPFTIQYVWAGLIVLLGILLNLYNKNRTKVNSWIALNLLKFFRSGRTYSTHPFQV